MTTRFTNFFVVLKNAFTLWWEKDSFNESTVIAYDAIFSLL
jgi:hypothetical protein